MHSREEPDRKRSFQPANPEADRVDMQWLLALTRTDDPRSCPACHADYIVHRDPETESRGASARLTTHIAQSTVAHSLCNNCSTPA